MGLQRPPDEAALPAEPTRAGSREFLLTVGFPAVHLGVVGTGTRHLRDEDGLEPFDADEIHGERCPDDDSLPVTPPSPWPPGTTST
ncbi:hypothetical protein [Streptomyces sp. NRRL S-1022]|uniref:hypothetical protein n=1 Tax=Streptomyces sp. NRRL S-1022 TaxID=1463880 RepID=UPI00068A51E4|nr:hypothetical protein [Streptomyces sp. NRRL S-1022]